jgi:hypothetical protein
MARMVRMGLLLMGLRMTRMMRTMTPGVGTWRL